MNDENPKKDSRFFIGFLLGGILGAILIFILGTKEGKKFADKLLENFENYEEDVEIKISKLQKKSEKIGHEIAMEAEIIKNKVTGTIQEEKKTAVNSITPKLFDTLTAFEKLQKKGVEITQDTRKRFFKKGRKVLNA